MTPASSSLSLGRPRWSQGNRPAASLDAWLQRAARDGVAHASDALHGDFALAGTLPDGRTVLAVDRFAMQTLCWRVDQGQLRFAARADELADGSTPVDPQAIFDYLFFHAIPSPRTIYEGVYRLPPGHCLEMRNGKPVVTRYWTPRFETPTQADFTSLRDEFQSLLAASVDGLLDGSQPACFLSGGTDSSTVAGMIRRAGGRPAASYSIGFDAAGYDEMAYARIAAKAFGTAHHEYYVTPADLVENIPVVAAAYDQPFGNSSALPAFCCARMARADGVTHILAGDGGDELFGGNARYAKQQVFEVYRRLPQVLRQGLLEPVFGTALARRLPGARKVASYIEQASRPMPGRLAMYNLVLRLGVDNVLTPGFLARIDQQLPQQHQQAVWDEVGTPDILNQELAFDWRYTLGEVDLPKVRGTTALAGLSVGFPMLDQPLVEFAARLPLDYKLRGQQLRWFFKEALRGFLPEEIITKQKHGFGLPFGVWVGSDPALRKLSRDALDSLVARNVVRGEFVRELFEQCLPKHPGYYGEMIWILMMLGQWLDARVPDSRF